MIPRLEPAVVAALEAVSLALGFIIFGLLVAIVVQHNKGKK